MRLILSAVAACLLLVLPGPGSGKAGVDATKRDAAHMELLIFEHPDCTYCQVFRAKVVPRYLKTNHVADAPLRFIDIANSELRGIALQSPITEVPTTVLVKHGAEVGRIPGYWAPDNYFKMVSALISKAEQRP
jgi:thioredoxin-related protein